MVGPVSWGCICLPGAAKRRARELGYTSSYDSNLYLLFRGSRSKGSRGLLISIVAVRARGHGVKIVLLGPRGGSIARGLIHAQP